MATRVVIKTGPPSAYEPGTSYKHREGLIERIAHHGYSKA